MNSTGRGTRWGALVTVAAMALAACSGGGDDTSPTTTVEGASNTPSTTPTSSGGGTGGGTGADGGGSGSALGIRLSEGTPTAESAESLAVAEGAPLSDADIAAVVGRLPEWTVPDTDVVDFNRPVESLAAAGRRRHARGAVPAGPGRPERPRCRGERPARGAPIPARGRGRHRPVHRGDVQRADGRAGHARTTRRGRCPGHGHSGHRRPRAGIDGRWRWIGTRTPRFEVTPAGDDDRRQRRARIVCLPPPSTRSRFLPEPSRSTAPSSTTRSRSRSRHRRSRSTACSGAQRLDPARPGVRRHVRPARRSRWRSSS